MDENKIIELYKAGNSSYQISVLEGISPTTVRRILGKLSIKARSNKTSDEIEEQIIDLYQQGNSSEKIASKFEMNGTTICRILKRNGIELRNTSDRHRKYEINENFFDIIDLQDKAYVLGFMFADGNVHSKYSAIKIEVHEKDVDIIDKIQGCIFVGEKSKIGIDREIYRFITVTSLKIKSDLIKHGCVPNKTFKVTMPTLHDDLVRHFLRGLYDGDGCISTASDRVRVILTGYTAFLEEIKTIIYTMTGIVARINFAKKKKNVSDLSITNRHDCIKFLNWIYKDSTIYLNRKFESYQKALEICQPSKKYGSTNIVAYHGNKLTNTFIRSLSIEDKEKVSEFLFDHFRQNGFPYQTYYESELIEDFQKLSESQSVIFTAEDIGNFPECGMKISKHFCPHFYEVKGNKLKSMLDAFNNDSSLMSVIKNRLGITYKETFNITGNMIRQGIRNSYNGFSASIFKPSLAKAIYDNFAPENSLVLDISAGFGQRMLGAMASKKVMKYIGIDPWNKQIEAISNMSDLFGFGDKLELHKIGSENFCPEELKRKVDFCFSSPPFFDKEIYCDDESQAYSGVNIYEFLEKWWVPTYKNVHSLLKDSSLFIVNMDNKIANIMIAMCKEKFELIDTKYISYKRSHLSKDSYDRFFVLRKL